jgi:hypothetical protein
MTKYSIKNICLGIGIGLVFSSILNINTAPRNLTIEDIRKAATKYNLIVVDAKDLIQKLPIQEVPSQEKPNQDVPKQEQPMPQTAPNQEQVTVIVINSGSNADGIAELLLSNKLIENKQAFLNRLTELKKESKLQIGTFKIPTGATVDKIIDIITLSSK